MNDLKRPHQPKLNLIAPQWSTVVWQWRTVLPDLVKFRHFVKSLQVVGNFLTVYFLFGKICLLWHICDINGLIFIVANVQILKNNLTIWSHWIDVLRGQRSVKISLQNIFFVVKCWQFGPWWLWSSGQRTRLLLWWSEFESRWSLQFDWKLLLKRTKINKKMPGSANCFLKCWQFQVIAHAWEGLMNEWSLINILRDGQSKQIFLMNYTIKVEIIHIIRFLALRFITMYLHKIIRNERLYHSFIFMWKYSVYFVWLVKIRKL